MIKNNWIICESVISACLKKRKKYILKVTIVFYLKLFTIRLYIKLLNIQRFIWTLLAAEDPIQPTSTREDDC